MPFVDFFKVFGSLAPAYASEEGRADPGLVQGTLDQNVAPCALAEALVLRCGGRLRAFHQDVHDRHPPVRLRINHRALRGGGICVLCYGGAQHLIQDSRGHECACGSCLGQGVDVRYGGSWHSSYDDAPEVSLGFPESREVFGQLWAPGLVRLIDMPRGDLRVGVNHKAGAPMALALRRHNMMASYSAV